MSIAPISPVEQPEVARPARVPIVRELLFALLAAVVVAALGAPFGWLWSKLAPHVELVQTQYGPYPLDPEPEGYWADDGWFVLMSIGMGIVVALAAWFLLRRYRGPLMLAGLVIGSAAASVIAAWLGNKIGWDRYLDLAEHAPVNTHIFRPVKLRTGVSSLYLGFIPWVRGTMLIQALAAAAIYTGMAGFHVSPTLRYDNIPPEYLAPPQGTSYPAQPADQPQFQGAGYQPYPFPAAESPYPPGAAQPQFPPSASPYPPGPVSSELPPAPSAPASSSPAPSAPAPSWQDPGAPPPPPPSTADAPVWPSPEPSNPPHSDQPRP
ncbi:DUF2567 domain-containing protein [Dactylosporangium sp. CS-033363]|uniref:DUF2567 domain-containing protein n=1 Tax=Dactylosporangium sp. CS-033363 TaxID=3239935 RepID=UPI003D8A91E8